MDDIITWGDKLRMVKFILTTNRFTNGPKVRKFEEGGIIGWDPSIPSSLTLEVLRIFYF